MTPTTEEELKLLIKQYESDPLNLDLINSIAIGYFENPEVLEDNEDELFFERAYSIKKTVKSINNYAWYLKHVNEDKNKALEIQKECIDLNPKSFMPYNQYGLMLLEQNQYEKALEYLLKANSITKKRDTINNIGYCYFKLGDYIKAHKYFLESSNLDDVENISLYNLALTEYKLGNFENLKFIAKKLEESIEVNRSEEFKPMKDVNGLHIARLYYLIDDFNSAYNCLFMQECTNFEFIDNLELFYVLFLKNNIQWKVNLNENIQNHQNWIEEILNNHEDWAENDEKEKEEYIIEFKNEIDIRTNYLKVGATKTILDINHLVMIDHYNCLLFDCKRHENIDNDY